MFLYPRLACLPVYLLLAVLPKTRVHAWFSAPLGPCTRLQTGHDRIRAVGVFPSPYDSLPSIGFLTSEGELLIDRLSRLKRVNGSHQWATSDRKRPYLPEQLFASTNFELSSKRLRHYVYFFLATDTLGSYLGEISPHKDGAQLKLVRFDIETPNYESTVGNELTGVTAVISGQNRVWLLNGNCGEEEGKERICQVGYLEIDRKGKPVVSLAKSGWFKSTCSHFCISPPAPGVTLQAAFYLDSKDTAFYFFDDGTILEFTTPHFTSTTEPSYVRSQLSTFVTCLSPLPDYTLLWDVLIGLSIGCLAFTCCAIGYCHWYQEIQQMSCLQGEGTLEGRRFYDGAPLSAEDGSLSEEEDADPYSEANMAKRALGDIEEHLMRMEEYRVRKKQEQLERRKRRKQMSAGQISVARATSSRQIKSQTSPTSLRQQTSSTGTIKLSDLRNASWIKREDDAFWRGK